MDHMSFSARIFLGSDLGSTDGASNKKLIVIEMGGYLNQKVIARDALTATAT